MILNSQKHLPPVFALVNEKIKSKKILEELVAEELSCKSADILGLDLQLFNLQKGALGGVNGEFIFSTRLDNLASSHAALSALVETPQKDWATHVLVFYDNEEVGSLTAQGGSSPFLKDILERICSTAKNSREAFMKSVA